MNKYRNIFSFINTNDQTIFFRSPNKVDKLLINRDLERKNSIL